MKKYFPVLLLAALAIGCSSEPDNSIVFDVANTDKVVRLANTDDSPTCSVHLEMTYATDANGHKAEIVNNAIEKRFLDVEELTMKQAADSFANSYTYNYIKNFLPLYNEDRADTTKHSWYEYHYVIKTEAHPGYKGTTAYQAILDYYEGGAHGINQRLTMNFDNETGRTLSLADIFVAGYENQLTAILQKALCEKVGAKDLNELHDRGYLFSMDMFPSENFVLEEETITFVYNPYEIAPYAMGSTELTIAYSALESILKNSFQK